MILGLKEKLTKILIDKKLLSQGDLEKALVLQKAKGGSLGDILVELGLISKSDLMIILSQELGIPPINLSRYKIDPAVIKLIPKKIARQYRIMPISKMGDTLTIALSDPLNIFTVDDIKALIGFRINPIVTTEKDIREAIGQYYEESAHTTIEKIVDEMKEESEIKLLEESDTDAVQSSS